MHLLNMQGQCSLVTNWIMNQRSHFILFHSGLMYSCRRYSDSVVSIAPEVPFSIQKLDVSQHCFQFRNPTLNKGGSLIELYLLFGECGCKENVSSWCLLGAGSKIPYANFWKSLTMVRILKKASTVDSKGSRIYIQTVVILYYLVQGHVVGLVLYRSPNSGCLHSVAIVASSTF